MRDVNLKPVNISDFAFGDGSMNARQYHAWLWAQIPDGLPEAKLKQMSAVINALTMDFMVEAMTDEPIEEQKGGLAELLRGK